MNPLILFVATYVLSAMSGLGYMLTSKYAFTAYDVLGTLLVYGAAGSSFGALVYMKYETDHPLLVIAAGQLVGLRMIPVKTILHAFLKSGNNHNINGSSG